MSIPFSPTRADSGPEATETTVNKEEQAKMQTSAGGDGAPVLISEGLTDDAKQDPMSISMEDGSSIEQIRDLLFGRQMGAYEERFSMLERRIQEAMETLRQEIRERLDSKDGYFREEAAGLGRRITQERDIRTVAIDELVSSLRQHRDAMGKRIDGVEKAANEGAEALRAQVLNEAKRAQESLETKTVDLRRTLEESVSALVDRKADRQSLAALLVEVASRLSEGDNDT